MSDAVTALGGKSFDGLARVADAGLTGMITLRGDFSDEAFAAAVKAETGLQMPGQRRVMTGAGRSLLWMSPDELMLVCAYEEAPALAAALAVALKDLHALAINVSDARAVIALSGGGLREVIGKLAPVDMAPGVFEPGEVRRTRLAQAAAAFWMDDAETARVICFRSVADYVFGLLANAADPESAVGVY